MQKGSPIGWPFLHSGELGGKRSRVASSRFGRKAKADAQSAPAGRGPRTARVHSRHLHQYLMFFKGLWMSLRKTQQMGQHQHKSNSLSSDSALSRRQQGFESPWGRHIYQWISCDLFAAFSFSQTVPKQNAQYFCVMDWRFHRKANFLVRSDRINHDRQLSPTPAIRSTTNVVLRQAEIGQKRLVGAFSFPDAAKDMYR